MPSKPGGSRPRKAPVGRAASGRRPAGPAGPRRPKDELQGGRGEGASRFTGRAIVLLVIVLLLVASYASSMHTWWQLRQDIQTAEAEIATRHAMIEKLQDEKERWKDPAYVRQQARERFGWVLPGEVGYRVIRSDGTVRGATLDEVDAKNSPDWGDRLWRSVQIAGEDPAQRAASDDKTQKVLK